MRRYKKDMIPYWFDAPKKVHFRANEQDTAYHQGIVFHDRVISLEDGKVYAAVSLEELVVYKNWVKDKI